jgi:hypothetical protein
MGLSQQPDTLMQAAWELNKPEVLTPPVREELKERENSYFFVPLKILLANSGLMDNSTFILSEVLYHAKRY